MSSNPFFLPTGGAGGGVLFFATLPKGSKVTPQVHEQVGTCMCHTRSLWTATVSHTSLAPGFLVLGSRKENLVYTVRACAEFPWYPAYYMYSNVWSVSVYLLKGRSAGLYSLWDSYELFWSQKFWGNWACSNSMYQGLFPLPKHESLRMRLVSHITWNKHQCCLMS